MDESDNLSLERMRVRVRTVDMLGRQQIANIPTAIHELFKNAHDAYARRVIADFFRADRLLVLRDDGLGMTRHELTRGWLTLGTEAKIGANASRPSWTGLPPQAVRTIMGEKGIGRLAIAAVGPQVLIMTRASREVGLGPLLVALVSWEMFELPGVDLDQIEIPVVELPGGTLPNRSLVRRLVDRVRANINSLGAAISQADQVRICSGLDLFEFDPATLATQLSDGPFLHSNGHGTHFLIRPTSEMLVSDVEPTSDDEATQLEKYLLGFSNTMMPDRPPPEIKAEFRDHREDGSTESPISDEAFFTPEEFRSADHHIDGRFDSYGNFSGAISVYRGDAREHVIPWPGATGRPTSCGPFRIRFAYLQGEFKDTRLPAEEWALLSKKLNRVGGLYIYRDGIRILPYGGSDQDFIGIERRRTKSASDWFFSYRRIFGAVEITHGENGLLQEKAGREGFRRNQAYAQFVGMLENFFRQLAVDFFRTSSKFGDFVGTRAELNRAAELLAKREKSTRERRRQFGVELDKFFTGLEAARPSRDADEVRRELTQRLATLDDLPPGEVTPEMVMRIESEAQTKVRALSDSLTVSRPRGVGLTKAQQADWEAYQRNLAKLRDEVVDPLANEVAASIGHFVGRHSLELDRRRRLSKALEEKGDRLVGRAGRLRREVDESAGRLVESIKTTVRASVTDLAATVSTTVAEFGSTDTSGISDGELDQLQARWDLRIDESARAATETLEGLRDQLTSLMDSIASGDTLDAVTAAIESQAEAQREQLDLYIELAQVGMALGIVQHEFGSTIRHVRRAIRRLQPWAEGTPELREVERELRDGFEHLDAYLNLFAPLSRRLSTSRIELSGEEIRRYITDVFGTRAERHSIRFDATSRFDTTILAGQPSAILAAFVNLVDNGIYWVQRSTNPQRVIVFDADENGVLVSNSGPGIEERMADRIFEYGFTTKEGGRGIGLYVSREALRRSGLTLSLVSRGELAPPVFRIGAIDANDAGAEK